MTSVLDHNPKGLAYLMNGTIQRQWEEEVAALEGLKIHKGGLDRWHPPNGLIELPSDLPGTCQW